MARTRSKPAAKATKESTPEPAPVKTKVLPPADANPPKLFVLPKDTSKDARIVTLDNPANDAPSRYFFCPEKGFYEFTRIAAPKKDYKSWLITGEKSADDEVEEKEMARGQEGVKIGNGYVTKAADLFIATSIDLLFLILPALAPKTAKETKQHFLALDDHLDRLCSISKHWQVLLAQYPTLKTMIEKRMAVICDSVEAGNESMYRISQDKLLSVLLNKAERMCKNGLPPSMEQKFIKTALEVPVMSIKREESSLSVVSESTSTDAENSQASTTTTSMDSQSSTESVSTVATSISTTSEVLTKHPVSTPPEIPHLLRLRTAMTYLTSTYLPKTFQLSIQDALRSTKSPDFTPLNAHLAELTSLRSKAAALRSISDNVSRKRAYEEDDEKAAEREEKKRKKEEDERKKKMESRGVKQLKKVDTSGMKKLSAFFTKAPKKA
ncbi:hypothetical protein K458DRAFT_415542 [Lentithecium fluviatile CBS 122367]|uniref:Ribonuclease H2 subunit B n=1 Tax=Lentithecium fluviatile CBS 122367 TaxID=1168545 RepID=A0A6G1JAX0_9PLEO|nr:hypothetical protein K458DRAFT_415542 [Lentithecium fluviatile CBS 122367]